MCTKRLENLTEPDVGIDIAKNSTEPDVGIDIAKRFVLQFYPLTSRTRDVTANNCYSHQFITLISVTTCSHVDAV